MEQGMESIRQLYKIGRGPSSSHTMGPEKICRIFKKRNESAERFRVILYGSLSMTGKGHGTDTVIRKTLAPSETEILWDCEKKDLPHPNTMELFAYRGGALLDSMRACSIGGGEISIEGEDPPERRRVYAHSSFYEISESCRQENKRLWEYAVDKEGSEILDFLAVVWQQMKETIRRGLTTEGVLPGGLEVERKAKTLYNHTHIDESAVTKENRLVCAYAFAVGEENAAGGRVVTAPTCGASGVLPAVLLYHQQKRGFTDTEITHALATAGIVGMLVRTNASISGAECGCQAEIGTACSMAAAALGELLSMTTDQIEYASEIAIEHHLGLTCDPIRGLVQIPCIERNAVAAMRAIQAVNLANFLTNTRKISLDLIIRTMYETGRDISEKYRETSTGGMAKLYRP